MSTNDRRQTKAERKEQARLEREEIQRKQAARKRNRTVSMIVGIVIGAAVIAGAILLGGNDATGPSAGSDGSLPGVMTTLAPWGPNVEDLTERLDTLGLPGLSETVLHRHTQLLLYVNGEPVVVPGNVGWNEAARVFSPLHTHDETGTIHTESDDPNFAPTLGTLFDVWGLRLTEDCLGGYCTQDGERVRVFVNGEEVSGDPRAALVEDNQSIAVTYGTADEVPDDLPTSFALNG